MWKKVKQKKMHEFFAYLCLFYLHMIWKVWSNDKYRCTCSIIVLPTLFIVPFGILFGIAYLLGFELKTTRLFE